MRQAMSWSVFLQTDYAIKQWIRRVYGLKEEERIGSSLLFFASCAVAVVNTAMVMPLDCIKTHLEKVNPSLTYRGAIMEIYRKSGGSMLGFFTGVRLRFLLHLTNALFVVNILERLESWNKTGVL
uniref:Uncharacterized protein n=1 Tax=Strombidium rassoulzadegani TaxID=1082188 RepID=A0A7S3CR15_9SPIT|mmetsp:Transcript_4741/g.8106  ORF Transcript_4741/g.8106 Transcript_4741/m.8106 type:complete len:125 (+) Transcript_4741:647-1021(+)